MLNVLQQVLLVCVSYAGFVAPAIVGGCLVVRELVPRSRVNR